MKEKSNKRNPLSDDHKKKISNSLKGHKLSKETKSKIGEKNNIKMKKLWKDKNYRERMLKIKKDNKSYEKSSKKLTGRKLSEEHRKKAIKNLIMFGKGSKNPGWRGGIYPLHKRLRNTKEYRLWRIAVFERDNYTCVFCNKRGGNMEVDHIKPFSEYPELRFAIDNGRTLCTCCHRKTITYGRQKK